MRHNPDDAGLAVWHFGNDASSRRGGISAVIRQHLSSQAGGVRVSAISTYDPSARSHWRRNAPYLAALGRAVALRPHDRVIAHVHLSQRGSLMREGILVALLRLRRVPVVATLHGSSSLTAATPSFLLTGLILRCASLPHFLSEAHRRRYARIAGRSVTVPNVVDVERDEAQAATKGPQVVFAGVVGTRKGVDVLLRAWRAHAVEGWSLHLYGPLERDFELPECPGMVAHGEVPASDVRKALVSASIAVLPSREEAFPMFLLEAMAHRCAVVATDVGGVRDLVGDAGVLVPVEDAETLGRALGHLMSEPGACAEFATAAAQRSNDRFDVDKVAGEWRVIYAELAGSSLPAESGSPRA